MTEYNPPEPNPYVDVPLYTESQLRSEVEKARREAIEECAKVCDLYTGLQSKLLAVEIREINRSES